MNTQITIAIGALFALATSASAHAHEAHGPLGSMNPGAASAATATAAGPLVQQGPGRRHQPNLSVATQFVTHFHARNHEMVPGPLGMRIHEVEDNDPKQGRVQTPRWGLPNMSTREFTFLLPYDASFNSIHIEVLNEATENLGAFVMAPVGLQLVGASNAAWSDPAVQLDPEGRDLSVYANPEHYPLEAIDVASVGQDRAMRMMRLVFHPFRWNPGNMQLVKVTELTVRVSWNKRMISQQMLEKELGDPALNAQQRAGELIVPEHFDQTYYYPQRDTTFDYLIVATSQVLAGSANMVHFINMKQSQGYKVACRSIEWIQAQDMTPTGPQPVAHLALRRYLKSVYQSVGLKYVMIISDHCPEDFEAGLPAKGSIPMFLTWPTGGMQLSSDPTEAQQKKYTRRRAPTDLYFAELSGPDDWDIDGDGFAGERRDDVRHFTSKPKKRYVTDFYQELGIARIPFDGLWSIDPFLLNLIEYQAAVLPASVLQARRRVLLAMAECWHWSATHVGSEEAGDAIYFSIPCPWNWSNVGPLVPHRIYQVGTFDEELIGDHTLLDQWKSQDAGLVVWHGHGDFEASQFHKDPTKPSSWGANKITRTTIDVDAILGPDPLDPTYSRAFVTSCSCSNASPWDDLAIASNTLLKHLLQEAAIGALLNTGLCIGYRLRDDNIGSKCWADDIMVSNVRRLCNGWSLSFSLKKTRERGDYSGTGINCGIYAQNLLVANAFGDPASFYKYQ